MTPRFDPTWYLQTYPDVAAAGVDPWLHYQQHGQKEGRLPRALKAQQLENALWGGFSKPALSELQALLQPTPDTPQDEIAYAAWALARWHAAHQDWHSAAGTLPHLRGPLPPFLDQPGPHLLAMAILQHIQRPDDARSLLQSALARWGNLPDLCLAAANLAYPDPEHPQQDADTRRLGWINRALQSANLTPIGKHQPTAPLTLDNLQGQTTRPITAAQPRISVIMPAYNAAGTIATALRSLQAQTWQNLEIIVVDDASTDATAAVVQQLAEQDPRIILIQRPANQGAYAARNRALQQATGTLITNHDSDDWSHPQRLERMAAPLLADTGPIATLAAWIRCDAHLHFQRWRMEHELIHLSVSTLMFRKTALKALGGWDEVIAGADAELYQRILHVWGPASVQNILTDIPMVLARQHPQSLTNAPITHQKTEFHGVRRLYRELSSTWHQTTPTEQLHLSPAPPRRPFPAPAALTGSLYKTSHYDWVILADFADNARLADQARQLVGHLLSLQPTPRLALFHWPQYPDPQPMAGIYLKWAIQQHLDILLAEQTLQATHQVILGTHLLKQAPDQLPTLDAGYRHVIDHWQDLHHASAGMRDSRQAIQASGLFDAQWYLRRYPDVRQHGIDPLTHYLSRPHTEDRTPGPRFDNDYYRHQCKTPIPAQQPLLSHYLHTGQDAGLKPCLPELKGKRTRRKHRPTLLLCGHAAGPQLFGAERSLLDVLDACKALDYNTLVTLPSMGNRDYLQALQSRCSGILHVATAPWAAHRPPCPDAIEHFARIIQEQGIDLVYVNTLVLREPLLAARQTGVTSLVHVREAPGEDPDLCREMGHPPQRILAEVIAHADHILANSRFVAEQFQAPGRPVHQVSDAMDPSPLDLPDPDTPAALRVSMISSHAPKKGLEDFIQVACELTNTGLPVRMQLFGPDNEAIAQLRRRQRAGELPDHIHFQGYVSTPREALAQTDVLLNLSRFAETFGRTVLEAMAAGRPVIAYAKGALPELMEDGQQGYLVPEGDIPAVVDRLQRLAQDASLRERMGMAGRQRAARYTLPLLTRQLEAACKQALEPAAIPAVDSPPRVSFILRLPAEPLPAQTLLASLLANMPTDLAFEIILLHDHAADTHHTWLTRLKDPRIRTENAPASLGHAAACNQGAALARGEILGLLSEELLLTPGWLEPMLTALAHPVHPVAMVGNLHYGDDGATVEHAGITLTPQGRFTPVTTWPADAPSAWPLDMVSGACCLVRKADFMAVGGFDEGYLQGGEDQDICLALKQQGKRVYLCRESQVYRQTGIRRNPSSADSEEGHQRLLRKWRPQIKDWLTREWVTGLQRHSSAFTAALSGQLDETWVQQTPHTAARIIAENMLRQQESQGREGLPPHRVDVLAGQPPESGKAIRLTVQTLHSCRSFHVHGHALPGSSALSGLQLDIRVNGIQRQTFALEDDTSICACMHQPLILPDMDNQFVVTVRRHAGIPVSRVVEITHLLLDGREICVSGGCL